MTQIFTKYLNKLFFKQWIIGLGRGDIKEIIRSKSFDPDLNWLSVNSADHFQADPFILKAGNGTINILFEDFDFNDFYGRLLLKSYDKSLKPISEKVLLDTKSHLSYPFIFEEENKIFVFPESAQSGNLSCYQYDPVKQSLSFLKVIINLPLLDSTIIKFENKYWLFATLKGKDPFNKLFIYFSDSLLGPYCPHPGNPVKNSLIGSRPAGNFIEVDDMIYRPAQNCKNRYGESITINKVNVLSTDRFEEEPYMVISINQRKRSNLRINSIHTINARDHHIVVDGMRWTFSPLEQWRTFKRNRRLLKRFINSKSEMLIQLTE